MINTNKYGIDELFEIYSKTKDIIQADYNSQTNFNHVNPFWKNILSKRQNFPSFTDSLSFLNNNSAFGLGKRMEENNELEMESYRDAYLSVNKDAYKKLSDKVSESLIGFPKYFEIDSTIGSTSFTENIISTSRLIEAVDKYLLKKEKINILEIGAGWGAVMNQLLQYYGDRINKIAICDLHENLFISSFYLQATFPTRKVDFVTQDKLLSGQDFSLNFCSPTRIQNLDIEFDLVINMISFQEMNLDVVDNYMSYIQKHLSKNGILYSENGVQVKNTLKLPEKFSDYKYSDYFKILDLRNGARFCPHLYFGNQHEIILTHKNEDHQNLNLNHLNALSLIINLRLADNINELKANTITGKNSIQEIKLLDLIYEFFSTPNKKIKEITLDKMSQLENKIIPQYIRALYLISQKKIKMALVLLEALEPELTGLVKINVLCYIGMLDRAKQSMILNKIEQLSPEMLNTAKSTFKDGKKSKGNMVEKLTKQLNINVKRWFGYTSYQLSFLPTILASRVLIKLEKKIVKMKHKNTIPYHLK